MTRPNAPNNFQSQAVSDTLLYNEGNEPSSGWQKGFKSGGTLEKRSNTLFLSVGSSSATQEATFEHPLDAPDFHFGDTFKVEFTTTTQGAPKFGGALPNLGDQPSNSGTSSVSSVNTALGNRNSENPNAVAIAVRDTGSKSAVNSDMTVSKASVRRGGSREIHKFWTDSSGVFRPVSIEAGPNNEFVYTGYSADNTVRKFSVADGSLEQEYGMTNNVSDVSVSPDGNFVYATDDSGILRKINVSSGNVKWEISNSSHVSAGPDGNFVYKSGNGNAKRLDAEDGSTQWTASVGMGLGIDIGSTGNFVFGIGGNVTALNALNGNQQFQNSGNFASVRAGPNGDFLYTGDSKAKLRKRDASDGTVVWVSDLKPNTSESIPIEGIVVGPKNNYVYASARKIQFAASFSTPKVRKIIPENGTKVWDENIGGRSLEISPGGSFLYVSDRVEPVSKFTAHFNEG